ncbi:MAG: HAMP domain-containing histidine kinase [Burkholderiaceae bacterium]|nr:HAMP domain-containing histidine kinase [Burkholderiaceae bacterium]
MFPQLLPQHEALRAIVLLRTLALLCQAAGLAAAQFWLGIELQLPPLLVVLTAMTALNLWSWLRMRKRQPAGNPELFLQLLADVAALSVLLYFSGGATNPFASFYLPALAVGAALLPWRYALCLTALAVAAYSLMGGMMGNPMVRHFVPLHMNDPERAIAYHLAGMWANFAVSAALITWFVARLSRALRERDAQLAAARERHLEQERLSALGMQAANAAHEMGTPLGTVALIAGDLAEAAKNNAALAPFHEDFAIIAAQITLCQEALRRMSANSGAAVATTSVAMDAWLKQCIADWRLRHPATRIETALDVDRTHIEHSLSVAQILTTLLDNAAQAGAANAVRVTASYLNGRTQIQVIDQGPGIAAALLPRLGYEQVESSSNGQGIGLLLAYATARRIGAEIALQSQPGGTTAKLTLPVVAT